MKLYILTAAKIDFAASNNPRTASVDLAYILLLGREKSSINSIMKRKDKIDRLEMRAMLRKRKEKIVFIHCIYSIIIHLGL